MSFLQHIFPINHLTKIVEPSKGTQRSSVTLA